MRCIPTGDALTSGLRDGAGEAEAVGVAKDIVSSKSQLPTVSIPKILDGTPAMPAFAFIHPITWVKTHDV